LYENSPYKQYPAKPTLKEHHHLVLYPAYCRVKLYSQERPYYRNFQEIEIPNWDMSDSLSNAPLPIRIGSFYVPDGIESIVHSIGTEPDMMYSNGYQWYSDEQMGLGSVPIVFAYFNTDGLLTELKMEIKQKPAPFQWQPGFGFGLGLGDPEEAFLETGILAGIEYEVEEDKRDPGRVKIYNAGSYELVFSDTRMGLEDGSWRLIEIAIQF
jgi:hypothetical protein